MASNLSCAIGVPNVGTFGDPSLLLELAVAAEEHGWDGFFVWDHQLYWDPQWAVADPVVVIAAVAARTARVRLGILVNVLARRRVGKVARESVTLDRLSQGRLVFGAGLGSRAEEFTAFGEPGDAKERAARLDESLELLDALWTGEPVSFRGAHLTATDVTMLPRPVQRPGSRSGAAGGGRTRRCSAGPPDGTGSCPPTPITGSARPCRRTTFARCSVTRWSTAVRTGPSTSRWKAAPTAPRPIAAGGTWPATPRRG